MVKRNNKLQFLEHEIHASYRMCCTRELNIRHICTIFKCISFPSISRGFLEESRREDFIYGMRNSRTKEMLSATRDGAPMFAKETDNSGIHDARIVILARVRSNNKQKNCTRDCCIYFDRLINKSFLTYSTCDKVILVSNNALDHFTLRKKKFFSPGQICILLIN